MVVFQILAFGFKPLALGRASGLHSLVKLIISSLLLSSPAIILMYEKALQSLLKSLPYKPESELFIRTT